LLAAVLVVFKHAKTGAAGGKQYYVAWTGSGAGVGDNFFHGIAAWRDVGVPRLIQCLGYFIGHLANSQHLADVGTGDSSGQPIKFYALVAAAQYQNFRLVKRFYSHFGG